MFVQNSFVRTRNTYLSVIIIYSFRSCNTARKRQMPLFKLKRFLFPSVPEHNTGSAPFGPSGKFDRPSVCDVALQL